EMLVDRDALDEAQAALVALRHRLEIAERVAAHHVVGLDRRPRGAAADDAAALQHGVHLLLGLGAQVGINEAPLPAAADPDGGGLLQFREERLGIRVGAFAGVQNLDAGDAQRAQLLGLGRLARYRIVEGGRDVDDVGLIAAGRLADALPRLARHAAATADHRRLL